MKYPSSRHLWHRFRAWRLARQERREHGRRGWRALSTGREEYGQQREDWR